MAGRASVVIVVVGMAILAGIAVSEPEWPLAGAAAVAAAAFATNLVGRLNPILRMMAFSVQVLALLVMVAALIGVLIVANAYSTDSAGSLWAGGLAGVAALVVTGLAITEGRRALRNG